nr:coiled-coil domain-containing protein 18-like [Ipomoea batatas]
MKKLFFFRSSASSGGSNTQISPPAKEKRIDGEKPDKPDKSRSKKKVPENHTFGDTPTLRRSLSFSSGSFYDGWVGQMNCQDQSGSPHGDANIKKSNRSSSRSRAITPERQRSKFFEMDGVENSYKVGNGPHGYGSSFRPHLDSFESSSHCSSNVSSKVLDRYIDGEQEQETSGLTSDFSIKYHADIGCGGVQLPPRSQSKAAASLPNANKQNPKAQSFGEARGPQLQELMENGFGNESPRKLAKKVVERLSQSRLLAQENKKEYGADTPITIEDIYHGTASRYPSSYLDGNSQTDYLIDGLNEATSKYHLEEMTTFQERKIFSGVNYSTMDNVNAKEDSDLELFRKFKDAEEQEMVLSEDLEEQNFLQSRGLSVPTLIQKIRSLIEDKVQMAREVSAALQGQIAERASAREEVKLLRAELDSQKRRLEEEKNELQYSLERELDRRSSEWSLKLERYHTEEHRLRDRVRELAEQNVSLQREVSSFSEKEVDNKSRISYLEKQLDDLVKRVEEESEENQNLQQNFSELQEKYRGVQEDQDCIRRNCEEKVKECKDLHRSITRLQRTCNEQEKTIDGLRLFYEEINKKRSAEEFDNQLMKSRMEQVRLVGMECTLRKELESYRLEVDRLRHENIHLLSRLKGSGQDSGLLTLRLDQELLNRVNCLQNQGLLLLKDCTLLCEKLLEYAKSTTGDMSKGGLCTLDGGLQGQFAIESDVKLQGFKRGLENLARSLQNVSVVLDEKSCTSKSKSQPSTLENKIHQSDDQKFEYIMQSELKSETLLTNLLREKLYIQELDMEQLQAELATAVRGNDMLKCELQNARDNLSCVTHKTKNLELQILKKDENIKKLQNDLEECMKELTVVKGILPKVSQERDMLWEEVKQYSESNMLLNSENNLLKKKIETLDEDILLKEGQITILKDTLGKPIDLLSIPGSTREFLVE